MAEDERYRLLYEVLRVIRESAFGWKLHAIACVTLVIALVLLLLLMQIQFLPFHNSFITWTHRLALVADLAVVWWYGARSCPGARLTAAPVASRSGLGGPRRRPRRG
jgi:hypothetical protein